MQECRLQVVVYLTVFNIAVSVQVCLYLRLLLGVQMAIDNSDHLCTHRLTFSYHLSIDDDLSEANVEWG